MHLIHSICGKCKHLDHDCGNGEGCVEFCNSPDDSVRKRFYGTYETDETEENIKECEGFTK